MARSLHLVDDGNPPAPTAPDAAPFTAAAGGDRGTVFRCALCGTSFTHGGRSCNACPLGAACDLVSCPNCGYGFPRRSSVVDWLRRTWRRLSDSRRG
jgi:hypothetical protein